MNTGHRYPKLQSVNAAPRQARPNKAPVQDNHWVAVARQWEQVGPPLRPSAQDIAFLTDTIGPWVRDNTMPRALILGVTPELYRLPWPDGTDILAIDQTQNMIDAVWPGPRNTAICAKWTAMPLKPGSRDIVLCDGGINLLTYPQDHKKLVQTLYNILVPRGLCILRLFVPPGQREAPDDVLRDLLGAKIPNLNLLKLRLGMALQKDIIRGVRLKLVWETIHRIAPDLKALASKIGWPLEHLLVINTYRNSQARYFFLSLDDVFRLFCKSPGGFKVEKVYVPTYELGKRCPTVVLRRVDTAGVDGDG